MLAEIGYFLLLLAALSSGYSFLSALAAAWMRHRALLRSAKFAATASTVLAIGASLILWWLLFQRDYSVAYIFRNSSNDLPAWYTIAAFWSAMEGSHMLWTLLLSIFACIGMWTVARDNEHISPYIIAALQGVLTWMFWLASSYSDPLARMFPYHDNGQGMNALLQNPYMAIHPPMLFTGYTALSIPFAYAVAALCYGDVTEGWLRAARRWTLFAWMALTVGVFLGGRWAYVELGWAGYWAWDPVENSSFMPWLLATALLHSLIVQERLGHLKRLSIVLAGVAFSMSFVGTFITRSGVISSVHSFAESPIGPSYLSFVAGLFGIFLLLYFWRAPGILPSAVDKVWGVSKESALVITQFLILTFASIIFIGTMFPIVSEALVGQRTSVQAPYFNAFAPWVGLGMIMAIALGNIMRYQTSHVPHLKRTVLGSLVVAIPLAAFLLWGGDVWRTPSPFGLGAQVVGLFLCAWSIGCLTFDLYDRLEDTRFSWRTFWQFNRAYLGGYVAHVGVMVAIIGFLGNYRSISAEATLKEGETAKIYGYELTFSRMRIREEHNATLFEVPLMVKRDGVELGELVSAKSRYPTKPELLNEIGVMSRFWHDLYIVVAEFDKTTGRQVTLQMHINPMVRLVWVSAFLMVLGGAIAISDRYRGQRSRDTVAASWQLKKALGLLLVAGSLFFVTPKSWADGENLSAEEFRYHKVAGELRCPTCTGLSVLDSDAPFSLQIRREVKEQLAQGRSEKEIMDFFVARYGPWILRSPPKEGVGLSAWLIPALALILGPFIVWFGFWRRPRAISASGIRSRDEIEAKMRQDIERLRQKRGTA